MLPTIHATLAANAGSTLQEKLASHCAAVAAHKAAAVLWVSYVHKGTSVSVACLTPALAAEVQGVLAAFGQVGTLHHTPPTVDIEVPTASYWLQNHHSRR